MNRLSISICALLLTASANLSAQVTSSPFKFIDAMAAEGGAGIHSMRTLPPPSRPSKPFSSIAFGGGISPLGVNMAMATNLNRHMNARITGNLFNYNVNNFTTNGFSATGKLTLASAGTAIDYYPFPNHGFRISPGALFYNQNALSANATVAAGQSFKLNDVTYYSSKTNPVTGIANLGLNTNKQAFTATTGWGNMIPRRGGHLSFPLEVGAAFIGSPTLQMSIAGVACDSTGVYCIDVAKNAQLQTNFQAQVAKYKKDLDPLKTYPIVSFGVAYSFNTRSGR
jgi:hypothetical protein